MKPPVAGQDFDLPEFSPAVALATLIGRPYRTIQNWATAGVVRHQIIRGVLMVATLEVVMAHQTRREVHKRRGPRKPDGPTDLTTAKSAKS